MFLGATAKGWGLRGAIAPNKIGPGACELQRPLLWTRLELITSRTEEGGGTRVNDRKGGGANQERFGVSFVIRWIEILAMIKGLLEP